MPRQTDTSPVSFQYMYASDDFVPAPSACMMLQYSACTKARNFQQSPTGWHGQLPTRVDVYGMQAVRDEHKQERKDLPQVRFFRAYPHDHEHICAPAIQSGSEHAQKHMHII
jgi:hypothetical protein